ncbi:MAG: hypothetical protein ACRD2D_06800, partial [Terriglobales bacterium]
PRDLAAVERHLRQRKEEAIRLGTIIKGKRRVIFSAPARTERMGPPSRPARKRDARPQPRRGLRQTT